VDGPLERQAKTLVPRVYVTQYLKFLLSVFVLNLYIQLFYEEQHFHTSFDSLQVLGYCQ
jgi:hypothetical protein